MQVEGTVVQLATDNNDLHRSYHKIAKAILAGDARVGKSTLFCNLTDRQIELGYRPTFGVDFQAVQVPEENCRLQLWDLSGMPQLQQIIKAYFRGATAVVYVADATRQETIANLAGWREQILQGRNDDKPFHEVVVITKMDSPRALSQESIDYQIPETLRHAPVFCINAREDIPYDLTISLCTRTI